MPEVLIKGKVLLTSLQSVNMIQGILLERIFPAICWRWYAGGRKQALQPFACSAQWCAPVGFRSFSTRWMNYGAFGAAVVRAVSDFWLSLLGNSWDIKMESSFLWKNAECCVYNGNYCRKTKRKNLGGVFAWKCRREQSAFDIAESMAGGKCWQVSQKQHSDSGNWRWNPALCKWAAG